MLKATWILASVVLLAAALMSGCGEDKGKIPGPYPTFVYLPQSSPASCLDNLIQAYTQRDSAGYAALFSDNFTFAFSPDDISQDPTIPEDWGLAEELESARRMFGSSIVDDIEVFFTQSVADSAFDEYPGTWKVRMSEVELRVYTRTGDGEPLTLKVSDGFGTFYCKEYPGETASDGRPLWRIWRWEDQPIGPKAMTVEMTWGYIKAKYH